MKLASKKNNTKDGELILVSRDLKQAVSAKHIAPNLISALENWGAVKPKLEELSDKLNKGALEDGVFAFKQQDAMACLPRTYLFADGSSFVKHVKLVREARKAPLPETLYTVPLMYQGESARFLSPYENIPQISFSHGVDFEAEIAVITDFVPMGTPADKALDKVLLVLIMNDVSLRGLIPQELAQGFGFFQSKPASSLSPVAVSPDELGSFWKEGRLCLPLNVHYNGESFGRANGKEMHFHFGELIAHAARTRDLQPGTLIGSGTVANEDTLSAGSSCLAEKRMLETIQTGTVSTPFMAVGDTITIEMFLPNGHSVFGRIHQMCVPFTPS